MNACFEILSPQDIHMSCHNCDDTIHNSLLLHEVIEKQSHIDNTSRSEHTGMRRGRLLDHQRTASIEV